MPVIPATKLTGIEHRVFAAGGSSEEEAGIIAGHLVEANLTGHNSHGGGMIPTICATSPPARRSRTSRDGW
jgi:uncharacterized oxidoreductase